MSKGAEGMFYCNSSDSILYSHSLLQKQYTLALLSYLLHVPLFRSFVDILVEIQLNQAAKGVTASYDTLGDFLKSIEHFISCLNIYTQIFPTPATDEIMEKILVKLFSMFALVTKEVKQGQLGECILTNVVRYNTSQICQ